MRNLNDPKGQRLYQVTGTSGWSFATRNPRLFGLAGQRALRVLAARRHLVVPVHRDRLAVLAAAVAAQPAAVLSAWRKCLHPAGAILLVWRAAAELAARAASAQLRQQLAGLDERRAGAEPCRGGPSQRDEGGAVRGGCAFRGGIP